MLMLVSFSAGFAQRGAPPVSTSSERNATIESRISATSRDTANKVSRLLDEMLAHAQLRESGEAKKDKVARLSEAEVNAYIQYQILQQGRPGLRSVRMRFLGNNLVGVSAIVDFSTLPVGESSLAVRAFKTILSGNREVYIEGTLSSRDGTARFIPEKTYVGGLRLPVMVLTELHDLMARMNAGKSLSEPRPLPYGLRSIEVVQGALILRS
jgi:hypothetical protein